MKALSSLLLTTALFLSGFLQAEYIGQINTQNFNEVINRPVAVIEFYSYRCPHCKTYTPIFEKVARKSDKNITFAKIESSQSRPPFRKMGVSVVPTTIIFKNGKEVARKTGSLSANALESFVSSNL